MRKILLPRILLGAALLALAGCTTASRMGDEVSGWFSPSSTAVAAAPAPGTVLQPLGAPQPPPGYAGQGYVAPNTPILAPADPGAAAAPPAPPVAPVVAGRAMKVALLLPLSGEQASLGKNLMNGAEMATMELGRESFELMPRDSGATPQEAQRAANEAIRAGAQLVIGPLFSTSVEAVKPITAQASVPMLALSNDGSVAGSGVYVMGFSPVEQVQRITGFAAAKGLRAIAILAPSSLYGDLVVSTAKQAGSPVNVVAVARYTNSPASIAAAVQELVAQRANFNALLLPEGGATLHQVAAQLSSNGMSARQLPLLGTGLWDEEKTANDFALIGGWYAAPDPAARAGFTERYAKNFGSKPLRLASLSYDATALAVALAAKGGDRPFSDASITNPNGFAGIDGIFRLTPRGTTERGLAVMEVTKSGPKVIDAAPKRF
jgi:ABC-type branched-subunit amino acid transport system substrate-binding protein